MVIESTPIITELDGVPVRVWGGVTESGIPCIVFVHRVAAQADADAGEFSRELNEQHPPNLLPLEEVLRQHQAGDPMPTGDVPAPYDV